MFKRFFLVLAAALMLCGLLCACGGTPAVSGPDESSISAFAPTDDPAVPPPPAYTNPLTGEGCEADISANRPIAVMLNNHRKALPQCGVSQADIIYEVCAEGGITRMMGVFQSLDEVGDLGSVRSARPYYVELAAGLDAIFIHAGGSDDAYISIRDLGVSNIDGVNGPYGSTMFWRDAARRKSAGLEHSLFTSESRIQQLLSGDLSGMRQTHKEGFISPLTFTQDATPAGSAANTVSVKFSASKTGVFTYDAQTGKYLVSQHGAPYMDGTTNTQVAVTNVLVVCTDIHAIKGDSAGRLDVTLTGSGSGFFACGGQYIPINWTKASESAPLTFTNTDGTPLSLGVGTSYINIVDRNDPITFG